MLPGPLSHHKPRGRRLMYNWDQLLPLSGRAQPTGMKLAEPTQKLKVGPSC
jgi:hypothetical protein